MMRSAPSIGAEMSTSVIFEISAAWDQRRRSGAGIATIFPPPPMRRRSMNCWKDFRDDTRSVAEQSPRRCSGIGFPADYRVVAPTNQETRMSIADMVYKQVKLLPDPLAREVLDFVGFLHERQDRAEWRDLMNAQATGLAAVWDNPEDRVWDDV
jgi:hypothetical protein